MNPNLKWKALFILAVILFCIYFLFGYPVFPTSLAQVKDNFSKQIKLGLDLQGGTHLLLRNIDPAQISQFRDLYNAQYSNVWDMSPAAGDPSGYTLTLRAGAIAAIQDQTMTQSVETIERRINALGLTEPTIQPRGGRNANEILVQLPGEGDPTRARGVIQAGGQLELKLVEDVRTYSSQAEALSRHGGVLPPGTELVPGRSETRNASGGVDRKSTRLNSSHSSIS